MGLAPLYFVFIKAMGLVPLYFVVIKAMGQAPLDGQTILSSQKITFLSRLKYNIS
jgi:hypothetical protein